jgi:hypothetical protein
MHVYCHYVTFWPIFSCRPFLATGYLHDDLLDRCSPRFWVEVSRAHFQALPRNLPQTGRSRTAGRKDGSRPSPPSAYALDYPQISGWLASGAQGTRLILDARPGVHDILCQFFGRNCDEKS